MQLYFYMELTKQQLRVSLLLSSSFVRTESELLSRTESELTKQQLRVSLLLSSSFARTESELL